MTIYNVSDIMDDSEESTAMRHIFNVYYPIQIKQIYLYDEFDYNVVGIPTTLDKQFDQDLSQSTATGMFNIADLAEFFKRRVEFSFENIDHPKAIYEQVKRYVRVAAQALNERQIRKEHMQNDERLVNFLKDIQLLEDFANALLPMIKLEVTDRPTVRKGFGRQRFETGSSFLRASRMLTEEQRRMFTHHLIDIRKELVPFVLEETHIYQRRDPR